MRDLETLKKEIGLEIYDDVVKTKNASFKSAGQALALTVTDTEAMYGFDYSHQQFDRHLFAALFCGGTALLSYFKYQHIGFAYFFACVLAYCLLRMIRSKFRRNSLENRYSLSISSNDNFAQIFQSNSRDEIELVRVEIERAMFAR